MEADIVYDRPVDRSEAGLPIGNGRMGSLVWTTPTALRLQINRADVFADNKDTRSFPRANTDYAGGCGYIDIHLVDCGDDVFASDGTNFRQSLSVQDGLVTIEGNGVTARFLAWHQRDVIAVEIDDQRPCPSPCTIDLRMLRYAQSYIAGRNYELTTSHASVVLTGGHSATSKLDIREGRILLTQTFREGDYHNASAVAIEVVGRPAQARYANESTVRLTTAPGQGKFTILIGSAATFDTRDDVDATALAALDEARALGFATLHARNAAWWADFWSKGYIRMRSADGVADEVARNYEYYLYLMASCSRGDYPPRFGGLLWFTNGDMRQWGTQQWWANLSCYYNGLAPANRFELMEPMFAFYRRIYESCAQAARQQWESEGIWIPETCWFDGLETLPDDIAAEMRDLYLVRKPWEERSERFRLYAETKQRFSSRWNWMSNAFWEDGRYIFPTKGAGPFGHTTHILSSTAKIAYLYYQRFEYAGDESWLRERAYPMLRGAVEFYRNFPNVLKGEDGKYHIHHVNSNEPVWGARDTDEDLSAMRGVLGALLNAAEILDADAELRPGWREFLDNLAPLPTSDDGDALVPESYDGPRVWVKARRPAVHGNGLLPDHNTLPMWNFDLCGLNIEDPETRALAEATFDAYFPAGIGPETPVGTLSRLPIAAAALGRADVVHYLIPNQLRSLKAESDFCDWIGTGKAGVLPNRLSLREGPGAIEFQRLGRAAEALHLALLQSAPPKPGEKPILRVFPAWPRDWDCEFALLARGAFLVRAEMAGGHISFVDIRSQLGGECRLINPWPDSATVILERTGRPTEQISGSLFAFETTRDELIRLQSVQETK